MASQQETWLWLKMITRQRNAWLIMLVVKQFFFSSEVLDGQASCVRPPIINSVMQNYWEGFFIRTITLPSQISSNTLHLFILEYWLTISAGCLEYNCFYLMSLCLETGVHSCISKFGNKETVFDRGGGGGPSILDIWWSKKNDCQLMELTKHLSCFHLWSNVQRIYCLDYKY